MKKAFGVNLTILFIYLAFFITFFFLQSYNHGLANIALIVLNLGLISYLFLFKEIDFEKNRPLKYSAETLFYGILPLIFLAIFFQLFVDPLNNYPFVLGIESIHSSKLPLPKHPFFFFFYTILFAPIIEELVFRQYLLNKTIFHIKKITFSIFLTSTVFSLIHLPNLSACLIAFCFSLFCSLIYLKYKNIIFSIIFHIFFNCIGILIKSLLITKYYDVILFLDFNIYYWLVISISGIVICLISYYQFRNSQPFKYEKDHQK